MIALKPKSVTSLTLVFLLLSLLSNGQNKNHQEEYTNGYRGGFIKDLEVPDKAVNFMVIGDWGRCGEYFQTEVAEQMARASVSGNCSFIISTGDNFYPSGVADINDPLWEKSYENVYHQFSLQKPWYIVLGNHDYKTNAQAEIDYSKKSTRWILPARYYSKKIPLKGDTSKKALFVFIDTNPLVSKYYSEPDYAAGVSAQDSAAQIKWLTKVLSENDTSVIWKFVVGHHPLYTSGKRLKSPETIEMRKRLEPLFIKTGVNAYFCGHEHQLEYLKSNNTTHHFISGAGSEVREVTKGQPESRFSVSDHGFMLFSLTAPELKVQVINFQGNVLFQEKISRK